MRLIGREKIYNTMDKANLPSAVVRSGEMVCVQTEMNNGDWLQSLEDRWDPSKSRGANWCTVLAVEGACPGDTLAVEIIDIVPEGLGYTGFAGWRTKLSQEIWPNDWDVVTRTVAIDSEGVNWSEALKLPLKPMIGTIGTAPEGEGLTNRYAYPTGGNMDVQEICPGITIYLPVRVPGGLLHVGDVHAIMGDGEIPHGGGIECRAAVTLRVTLRKEYAARKRIFCLGR